MVVKTIRAGTLRIHCTEGAERLDELLGWASRENPRRGFLFVSRVLGRHIPVAPATMRATYDELARHCAPFLNDAAYVVGMAETATGLGAGVADSLARHHPEAAIIYQHTTRHHLDQPLWLTLNEAHSHAVDHLLYRPCADLEPLITRSEILILIDDEMTTGRTLSQLATALAARLPRLRRVVMVTLVNWRERCNVVDEATTAHLAIHCVQLLRGTFEFQPNPAFQPQLPDNVDDDLQHGAAREDLGRIGLRMPYTPSAAEQALLAGAPTGCTVVGVGEHAYLPFLLAEQASTQSDPAIRFQSTTRSPILYGESIQRKLSINPDSERINYLYNLPTGRIARFIHEPSGYFDLEPAMIRQTSDGLESIDLPFVGA